MTEGGGNTVTERVILSVEAPKSRLGADNALTYAIKQASGLNREIGIVTRSYDTLLARMASVNAAAQKLAHTAQIPTGGGRLTPTAGSGSPQPTGAGGNIIFRAWTTDEHGTIRPGQKPFIEREATSPGVTITRHLDASGNFASATLQENLAKARAQQVKEREAGIASRVELETTLQGAHKKTEVEAQKQKRDSESVKRGQEKQLRGALAEVKSTEQLRYDQEMTRAGVLRNQALGALTPGMDLYEQGKVRHGAQAQYAERGVRAAVQGRDSALARAQRLQGKERLGAEREAQGFDAKATNWQTSYILETNKAQAAAKKFTESNAYIGRNMLENVKKVAAWTAALGVIYGSLRLMKSGAEAMVEINYQTARLSQVLRGGAPEAAKLTDSILSLAAANGRASKEAMESAIQWSRMGLSRLQVQEAVRVSLMASNVAELDTATATERLSALFVTYRLRVEQLQGVLGMLNNTSNTYNVSNKDLLDGLMRTAAAAKQAGIPLAELIGLIGAGVGATGQTGANIGNSVKSILGAFSNAQKLKMLREEYNFEGTEGAEGQLKDMSEMFSELWVTYNKMGQAERRSMLFDVAGRHQASRMAAILDNYVRSQTLAINAQLNLNSAEAENALILATLRSQIAGVMTEWQRFASIQGGLTGITEGLSNVTRSFRTLLAIANTPGISALTTLVGAGIVGMGAKTVLTAVTMGAQGKQAGFVGGTGRALATGWHNMGNAVSAAIVKGTFLRQLAMWAGVVGPNRFALNAAGQVGTPQYLQKPHFQATGLTKSGRPFSVTAASWGPNTLQGQLTASGATALSIIPLAGATSPVLTGFTKMGAAMKAVRLAGLALTDVIAPLMAISAAISGITSLLDKVGHKVGYFGTLTDEVTSALGKRAEQAGSAADAGQMQSRLLKQTMKVFGADTTTQAGRLLLADQVSEAFYPFEANDTPAMQQEKTAKRTARKQELEDIARIQDAEERRMKMNEFSAQRDIEFHAQRMRQRTEQRTMIAAEIVVLDRAIKKAEQNINPAVDANLEIQKLKRLRQAKINEQIGVSVEEAQDNEESARTHAESDIGHKAFVKRQKMMDEGIKGAWAQLAQDGRLSKHFSDLGAQEQIYKSLSAQLAEQKAAITEITSGDVDIDSERSKIADEQKALTTKRAELLATKLRNETGNSWLFWPTKVVSRIQGVPLTLQERELDAQQEALNARSTALESNPNAIALQRLRLNARTTRDNMEEADAQLRAMRGMTPWEVQGQQRDIALSLERAHIDSLGVGEGIGEQMFNKKRGLERDIARADRVDARLATEEQRDNLGIQQLERRVELQKMMIEGEVKLIELGKQQQQIEVQKNRERQRSLLTAGPAELLRKLAVHQMSGGGQNMSAGQFFALSPEARGDLLQYPAWSEEMRENRRSQKFLKDAGFGRKPLTEIQKDYVTASEDQRGARERLGGNLPALARDAAGSVEALAGAARGAAAALRDMARAARGAPPGQTSYAPHDPQALAGQV